MTFNMNDAMRRAGSRSRGTYTPPTAGQMPNIGQTPAVQAANQVLGTSPGMGVPTPTLGTTGTPAAPAALPPAGASSPMAAPSVQPSTFTLHPPGIPADPNQYTYEPQPDGAWRVYPPGVSAPPHNAQASLPRAASTADYKRMRDAFQQMPQTPGPVI
jgi:hypothetical protein